MNFLKGIFRNKDEIEPICPSCKKSLERAPGKKTKCPFCGEFMYVRTRPSDRQRVLVTKEGAEKIEEEWAIATGTHDQYIKNRQEVEDTREQLRKQFGKEPSENDVKWRILNKQLLEHASRNDWGLYRNTRLDMGELVEREGRLKDALSTYLEVCYIDINGPENLGGYDTDAKEYPRFDPDSPVAEVIPGIVRMAKQISSKLEVNGVELKNLFMQFAGRTHSSLKLPISPEEAWKKIEEELKKQS